MKPVKLEAVFCFQSIRKRRDLLLIAIRQTLKIVFEVLANVFLQLFRLFRSIVE